MSAQDPLESTDGDAQRAEIALPQKKDSRPVYLLKLVFTLGVGTGSGALFAWIGTPLPWLLGSLAGVMAAALSPLPIVSARQVRPPLATVLGVLMGSAVTPDFLDQLARWPVSIALVLTYTAVLGWLAFLYLHRIGGYDKVTSYFAGMPGALPMMVMTSAELGGDERRTALIQGCRIFLVVMTVPFVFQWVMGIELGARGQFSESILELNPTDGAILLGCAVLGYPLGKILRLPNAVMLGPAILSGVVHGLDWTTAKPPFELVILAQITLGTASGSMFKGAKLNLFTTALKHTLVLVLLFYITGVGFAMFMWKVVDIPLLEAILSLAPGGMPEMVLITMAVGGDVLFVVVHHLLRLVALNMVAPVVVKQRLRAAGLLPDRPKK